MRIVQRLGQELAGFVAGQDHGICVLQAAHDHLPWVYVTLDQLVTGTPDIMLPFPQPFASQDGYAAAIADTCEAALRGHTGEPTLVLPPVCRDLSVPVATRVCATISVARDRLLANASQLSRVIVVLVSLEVEAVAEAQAFAQAIVATPSGWPPWFSRMRIFVHVPLHAELGPLPRFVCRQRVDLSPEALTAGLAEDASDADLPPERRAQALLQVAMLDTANGRHEAATDKLHEVYAWATKAGNPLLSTLALTGLGDAACVCKDIPKAVAWYECALVPASQTGAALVMLSVAQTLARLYFELGRHAEAEAFYDQAQKLAMLVPDGVSHIQALHWRGRLEHLRGAHEAAAKSYLAAAHVARDHDQETVLAELQTLLTATRPRVSLELAREISGFLEGAR